MQKRPIPLIAGTCAGLLRGASPLRSGVVVERRLGCPRSRRFLRIFPYAFYFCRSKKAGSCDCQSLDHKFVARKTCTKCQ